MEKMRSLQENWRYQGNISSTYGHKNDINCKDLTETEVLKKKWYEYREEVNKKVLNDVDNHNGVVTHLEPDILRV